MDERQRRECGDLRALSSEEAATQLISKYAGRGCDWMAFRLLRCRTWKRKDQIRLARHFLFERPSYGRWDLFDHFASFMSLRLLVKLAREHKFLDAQDLYHVRYVLEPMLMQRAKSESEISAIREMVAESRFGKSESTRVAGGTDAT